MSHSDQLTHIYFSDVFGVDPKLLEEHGAFDISIITDLPLFIDPFLIFNSSEPQYQTLHRQIIDYVIFLRDKSLAGSISDSLLRTWFTFSEVKENWLGFSLHGNKGRGLGMGFARALNTSLSKEIKDFGNEQISHASHIEKVCLVSPGVGRDNISDLVTNLIKGFLLDYTQDFAIKHLCSAHRKLVSVSKARFNYETETWESRRYDLPFIDGEIIILTPTDILTKEDVWINRNDMIEKYADIASSVDDAQLRAQINNYFLSVLTDIYKRDETEKERQYTASGKRRRKSTEPAPTKKQSEEAAALTFAKYPTLIDYYIRWKEENGDEAEAQAGERVRASARLYIDEVRHFAALLARKTAFYDIAGTTVDEARQRVAFLKDVIENKGGWRLFYAQGDPIRRESDLHILFRLTWCNTTLDVSREVNDGRGPVDFSISRGRFDKTLIEFKLAKSSSLARNLENQVEVYKAASDAQHALKVIVFFTSKEKKRALATMKTLGLADDANIILIDARSDNKPSASVATDH